MLDSGAGSGRPGVRPGLQGGGWGAPSLPPSLLSEAACAMGQEDGLGMPGQRVSPPGSSGQSQLPRQLSKEICKQPSWPSAGLQSPPGTLLRAPPGAWRPAPGRQWGHGDISGFHGRCCALSERRLPSGIEDGVPVHYCSIRVLLGTEITMLRFKLGVGGGRWRNLGILSFYLFLKYIVSFREEGKGREKHQP